MRKLIIILSLLAPAAAAMAGDVEISGFVDGSYFLNTGEKNGEFGLDQVEVDIAHQTGEKTRLRADLEWIKDGEDFVAQVEQGYMVCTLPQAWEFTFGKFNAPIGFELLDAPDMYQYSHALVFDYGLPTNLTGASLAKTLGRNFDVVGYLCNGWDANSGAGKNVTWGGRLGYSQGGFGGGLAAITGKEESDDGNPADLVPFTRSVWDVDLSYETGRWLFGGEFNQGRVTTNPAGGELDQDWSGYLLMFNVSCADWAGFTFRYDCFDDQDGWAFEDVDGEFQKITSLTFCPTFSLDESFGALAELRIDKSNRDGFTDKDGLPTDTDTTVAFEMTYSW